MTPSGRVLLVGAGGLGSPAALALARSGVAAITIVDDDLVARSNLHRQTLYSAADVGRPKAVVAAERLAAEARERGYALAVTPIEARFVPDDALALVEGHDVVVEGADNFATKFLVADACAIARVPCVQAGAVRWSGWALATLPGHSACLRCVFEDVPRDRVETCAEAGVVGPVVGVLGAIEAALALCLLGRGGGAAGVLWSYRGLEGALRRSRVARRAGCALCEGEITDVREDRYLGAPCAV